jgi:hypothetical protein
LINNAFNPERSILGDLSKILKIRREEQFDFITNKYQTFLSSDNIINNSNILRTLEQQNPN